MPLTYHEGEHIAGGTNATNYSTDIVSTDEEQKTLLEVSFAVSVHNDDAYIVGKIDRDEFCRIPVNMLPVFDVSGAANTFQSSTQRQKFMIDHELKIGETVKFGVECVGTQVDFAYTYSFNLR